MIVRAIINPISGRRHASILLDELERTMAKKGHTLEITPTQRAGDAGRLAAEAPPETRAVVVVGGDGTVREAVEAMTGKQTPLVILPSGTENIVAKHYGYQANVERILDTLTNGRETACDVGVINGHRFFIIAGVGFDSAIVHRVDANRSGHISYLTYVEPIWHTFWRQPIPHLNIVIDGRETFSGQAMVFIGLLPRYSMGLQLVPHARNDDGLLDVCVLPCKSRSQILAHATRVVAKRHLKGKGVQYHQCHTLRISSDDSDIPVQMDGDPAGMLPIECSVIEAGVRLLLPP